MLASQLLYNDYVFIPGPNSRGPYVTIFKWNGARFVVFTKLATGERAYGIRSLTVDDQIFLAVARWSAQSSLIFKWNGTRFNQFQQIPSSRVGREVNVVIKLTFSWIGSLEQMKIDYEKDRYITGFHSMKTD